MPQDSGIGVNGWSGHLGRVQSKAIRKAPPMPASSPEEIHALLAKAFNDGDLDAFVEAHEEDAVTMDGEGTVASRRQPDGSWRIVMENPMRPH
jgi:ketosteroid isomerase-like protein